jgi:SAM-dependent methyltransferase
MSPSSPALYVGHDNLEVMEEAVHYNQWLADTAVRHMPREGRILDFGAGTGTLTRLLQARGLNILAMEPDATQAAQLSQRGLDVVSDLSEVAESSLAGIVTFNVLEHIEDDVSVMQALRNRLRPGGRLMVYVPAFPLLYSSMDRKVGHVRRYRRQALVSRLQQCGFVVSSARYADSIGFIASLAFRALGNKQGTLDPRAIRIYDRLVFPLSRLTDTLSGGTFGKNLLVLATRPQD